jgi:pimeloyl-ACP methyl ester carboxylesterase
VRFTLARLARGSRGLPRLIGRATSTGAGLATMERLVGEVRKMPKELWPAIVSHWCHPKSFLSMGRHLAELPASVASVIETRPLAGVPVTILTGATSRTKWNPGDLPSISSDTTHIVAKNSGHWIQLDEPNLVVDAVRDLVTRVRERERSLR